MEHEAGAGANGPDRLGVPDIQAGALGVELVQVAVVDPGRDHGDEFRAPGVHRPGDGGPDEPGGAGDDHPVPGFDGS
jgi:hypothetical protein